MGQYSEINIEADARPEFVKYNVADDPGDDRRQYRADRRARIRGLVNEIKLAEGCVDCGYAAHPAALTFDHVDPSTKSRDVGRMVSIGAGMAAIEREIAKCQVVCACCHAIREADRRDSSL